MGEIKPKLTTTAACRVARIDRDRFNEAVAADFFRCAPETVPGRARLFDPDDMVALWLYRELTEDGLSKDRAGYMACEVARVAKSHPDAKAVSYVQSYVGSARTFPADQVPDSAEWETSVVGGLDIRKCTTFNVGKIRELIAHYTEEERQIIGPDD